MFRPQAQAETHSNRRGSPLASASGTYFFLFINRLQAQAQARSSEATRHAQFY